jgi:hypothetical protein
MKKFQKAIIMAVSALAVALAVGVTSMGCSDSTTAADMTTMSPDMSVVQDMVTIHKG